jgi:alpha-acetolactate decarboxylase
MLDDGISNFKTKKNDYFQKMKDEHQKTLQRTNSQYLDLKNLFENIRLEENYKKIREKKKNLEKLKK